MDKLKVSTRLTLLIGMLALIMVCIGGLGLYGISRSNDALKTVYEDRTVALAHLGQYLARKLPHSYKDTRNGLTGLDQILSTSFLDH